MQTDERSKREEARWRRRLLRHAKKNLQKKKIAQTPQMHERGLGIDDGRQGWAGG
jgi:hypothetical protein